MKTTTPVPPFAGNNNNNQGRHFERREKSPEIRRCSSINHPIANPQEISPPKAFGVEMTENWYEKQQHLFRLLRKQQQTTTTPHVIARHEAISRNPYARQILRLLRRKASSQ